MPRRRARSASRASGAMRSFSSLALAAARSKAAVAVVLRFRRMRRSVTAQDLANVCESLDGGERVHFLPADSTGEAAATSSGLTRMIANGLPSGANAAMVGGDGKVDQVAAKALEGAPAFCPRRLPQAASSRPRRRPRSQLTSAPRSFLRQPRLADAVEHGREIRRVFLHPFDRDCGIETARFGQRGLRLVHPARMREGG